MLSLQLGGSTRQMTAIGLVHDYLLVLRGAERCFVAMADRFDRAPLYALLYDEELTDQHFVGRSITASYLQRLRMRQDRFRKLLPLYPHAAQRLSLREHDIVLSSSSAFAHGVATRPDAIHVCYCHSPFRYAWFEEERALLEVSKVKRPLLQAALAHSRSWDRSVSRRVTRYIANSELTRERIARYFERDAEIVHPPVEVDRFAPGEPEDYFVMVSELVSHKCIDLALQAARRADVRVVVVGAGPEESRLRATYSDVARFAGRVDNAELAQIYAGALAMIMPNVEEFGISGVEAQAAGRPVLAADAGGARETVVSGVTGVRFPVGDIEAIAEALRDVDWVRFDGAACRAQAERFSVQRFQEGIVTQLRRAGADVPDPLDSTGALLNQFHEPHSYSGRLTPGENP